MSIIVFDKYEIIRRLAVGGMGEIFLARQRGVAGFDRLVILKSLLPEMAQDEDSVNQFLDEARVAATLSHQNIVSIFEVGLWQGTYFIAMEFIQGESLHGLVTGCLRQNKTLPYEISAHIIYQAALGLDYAHKAKNVDGEALSIIHRDISPQNIMLNDDGVIKVVDFGIARAANRLVKTQTGFLKGKLSYMPPEQVLGKEIDARCDQYALGVTLWELSLQSRLFRQGDAEEHIALIHRITHTPFPRPSEKAKDFPLELESIIMRMCAKEPEQRFASCSEAAHALHDYLDMTGSKIAPEHCGQFLKSVCGEEIKSKVEDLTPVKDDFLITFGVDGTEQQMQTKKKLIWPWAIFVALLLVAGFGFLRLQNRPEVTSRSEEKVGQLELVVPKNNPLLQLTSTPSTAEVFEGRRRLGRTPLEIRDLEANMEYTLRFRLPGYVEVERRIVLNPGQEMTIDANLRKAIKKPKAKPRTTTNPAAASQENTTPPVVKKADGFLTLSTEPWTSVNIDGAPYGVTPLFKLKLSPGEHEVLLVNEAEGIRQQRVIKIESGQTQKVNWNLSK